MDVTEVVGERAHPEPDIGRTESSGIENVDSPDVTQLKREVEEIGG